MRKLPFVTLPEKEPEIVEVGTPGAGLLQFMQYGSFRIKEEAAITDIVHQQTDHYLQVKKLAYQIKRESGHSQDHVNAFMNDFEVDQELYLKYQGPLLSLQDNQIDLKIQHAIVTTVMQHRLVQPDGSIGDPGWSAADTEELGKELYLEILEFASREFQGEPEKKPRKKAASAKSNGFSKSSMPGPETGARSTGASEIQDSETTPDLALSGSESKTPF